MVFLQDSIKKLPNFIQSPSEGMTMNLSDLKAKIGDTNRRGPWYAIQKLATLGCSNLLFKNKVWSLHFFMHKREARIEYIPKTKQFTILGPMKLVVEQSTHRFVYLQNLNKTNDRSGTETLRLAVALARCLGSNAIKLSDASSIECRKNDSQMSLAWLCMLQGKPTFYEKFGFKHDDQVRIRECRNLVSKLGKMSFETCRHAHSLFFLRKLKRVESEPAKFQMQSVGNNGWYQHWFTDHKTLRFQAKRQHEEGKKLLAVLTINSNKRQSFGSRVGELSRSDKCELVETLIDTSFHFWQVQEASTQKVYNILPVLTDFRFNYPNNMTKRL